MSEHDGRTAFVRAYRERATQLGTLLLAVEWHALSHTLAGENITLTAERAAAWASRGYRPDEAVSRIRAGVTPELDGDLERHAEDMAGGRVAHLRSRLIDMVDDGTLVLPDED